LALDCSASLAMTAEVRHREERGDVAIRGLAVAGVGRHCEHSAAIQGFSLR